MLPHFEHLTGPLAQMVELVVTSYDGSRLVPELLREIGRLDAQDLARDQSGTRYMAQFLTELGERVPAAVLGGISAVLPQLDGEAYAMRNAILSMMGSIVGQVLRADKSETALKAREEFLDLLEQHIHDVSAYVRSRVLQVGEGGYPKMR